MIDAAESFNLRYQDLQPHQKKFWDTVESILQMGITPTPRVVNEALGKRKNTSWNGPLCRIRQQLLAEHDYVLVFHQRFSHRTLRDVGQWRWEKVADNTVIDEYRKVVGYATKWNPTSFHGECIVQYTDGSADSAFFSDLTFANGRDKAREYLNGREP